MAWIEIHIDTTAEHTDTISDVLTTHGAQAITMQDAGRQPIYEPALNQSAPLWPETTLVGLFTEQENLQPVTAFLQAEIKLGQIKKFSVTPLPEEDWERRCLDSFQPLGFGNRLWVCPSWKTPPDAEAINIILDPGLAFGTGTHETTALCLEWLAENLQPGADVIDYGCGSGILAVAAAKLGAARVIAIDHDPAALTATRENADLNQIPTDRLAIFPAQDYHSDLAVDVLIANILAQPLIELAPVLANLVKSGGKIVLSGILTNQTAKVVTIYNSWFKMQAVVLKGEWARLEGVRQ
jgi:ribosomal protein L11 methyltransferase